MPDHVQQTRRDTDLRAVLGRLGADPETRGRWLSKSEVVAVLSARYAGDPQMAFAEIRKAAKAHGRFGDVTVHCMGERRGTRYTFDPVPPDSAAERNGKLVAMPPSVAAHGFREFPIPPSPQAAGTIEIVQGDNLRVTHSFGDGSFDLIYIDPPFNTGHSQSRTRIRTDRDEHGDRLGFQGKRYRTTVLGTSSYSDSFDDYMAFLVPRLEEAHRLLKPNGSFFLHLDYREVHYAKVALDGIFGRSSFINEIIWAYDYGARATNRWSPKHDNILWYAKNPDCYCFNFDEIDRIPYMAPSLVGEEKAARGKTPTDAWWHTIVSPNGKEKTGYPTQKPLGILTRIVRVHSRLGDRLLDFFAGSGSFGEAAAGHGRHVTLVDENPEAIAVMQRRFTNYPCRFRTVNGDTNFEGLVSHTAVGSREGEDAAVLLAAESGVEGTSSLTSPMAQHPRESEAKPSFRRERTTTNDSQGSLF